jgi:hypothetical protein
MRNFAYGFVLGCLLLSCHFAVSQTLIWASASVSLPPLATGPASVQPVAVQPCAQPAEMFAIDEYDGPLHKMVAGFSRKLAIKTVASTHPHQHLPSCALAAREKFRLFVRNSFEPINFLGTAWAAGWAQRDRDDPEFHQGASGYGRRYVSELTDSIQGDLFNTFLYPAVFRQDPRYYRLGRGPTAHRLLHAMRHVLIAHSDSGNLMFNYSEWLGTASSKVLSNLYHPGNERGFGPVAQRAGWSISTDMGFDLLREFWPDLAHKFHLPFKTSSQPSALTLQLH